MCCFVPAAQSELHSLLRLDSCFRNVFFVAHRGPALAGSTNSRGAGARQWLEAQADGGARSSAAAGPARWETVDPVTASASDALDRCERGLAVRMRICLRSPHNVDINGLYVLKILQNPARCAIWVASTSLGACYATCMLSSQVCTGS